MVISPILIIQTNTQFRTLPGLKLRFGYKLVKVSLTCLRVLGLEPRAYGLKGHCSTTELHPLSFGKDGIRTHGGMYKQAHFGLANQRFKPLSHLSWILIFQYHGRSGIRTHGTRKHASFQDWYLKPLDHPSFYSKYGAFLVADNRYVLRVLYR